MGELSEQLRFILDLGVAVAVALIGGAIAVRLRQPAIVGYLLAGIVIGPATPGFVGDVERIAELADLGVVLLLFALGVEFSIRGLLDVRRVAIPGATIQILVTLVIGAVLMVGLGFGCARRSSSGRACRCRRPSSCSSRSSTAARWTASTARPPSAGRSSRTSRRSCSSSPCRRWPAVTSSARS